MIIHHEPFETELLGKKFYIAHGDDLGEKDKKYQIIKRLFHNKLAQWVFAKLHPDFAIGFAHRW